jgi:hypothetical protein
MYKILWRDKADGGVEARWYVLTSGHYESLSIQRFDRTNGERFLRYMKNMGVPVEKSSVGSVKK